MRSIWSGAVAFGMVNVPVKVYSATESHDVEFRQVHDADGGRIRYKRVCDDCGEPVEYSQIARAYEHADGRSVMITDSDIAGIPAERGREIEVVEFVPAADIDPIMFEKSYFAAPDGKSTKAYALLAQTLAATDQVAIVRFSMRNRTRLAALRVKQFGDRQVMVIHTLLWGDEIRSPEFPKLDVEVELKPAELDIAGQLVASMSERFDGSSFADDYQNQLRELVAAKLDGGEAVFEELDADAAGADDVSDLLAKLEASIKVRSNA